MSRYTRIATKFWTDEKVIKLSAQEKLLLLYIYTSPHSNMSGLYVLPKLYAMHDLGWGAEQIDEPFGKLLAKGFIHYHADTSVILIPNFLKYNPIQNNNQAKGAAKALLELPGNALFPQFRRCLERFAKPFSKPFDEVFAEQYANTATETVTVTATATATTGGGSGGNSGGGAAKKALLQKNNTPPNNLPNNSLNNFPAEGDGKEKADMPAQKTSNDLPDCNPDPCHVPGHTPGHNPDHAPGLSLENHRPGCNSGYHPESHHPGHNSTKGLEKAVETSSQKAGNSPPDCTSGHTLVASGLENAVKIPAQIVCNGPPDCNPNPDHAPGHGAHFGGPKVTGELPAQKAVDCPSYCNPNPGHDPGHNPAHSPGHDPRRHPESHHPGHHPAHGPGPPLESPKGATGRDGPHDFDLHYLPGCGPAHRPGPGFAHDLAHDTGHDLARHPGAVPAAEMANTSPEEREILTVLAGVERYPFDFNKDRQFIRELGADYPALDLVYQVKKWRDYKRDKPLLPRSSPRAQLRNWLNKAQKWKEESSYAKNSQLHSGSAPRADPAGKYRQFVSS